MADKAAMLDALADCGVALGGAGAAGTSHASLGAIAASRGHINALKALATRLDLSSHAGRDGWTAAGAAALEGSVASLEALFALGVDLSRACNRHGEPPLVVATKLRHAAAAKCIERHADARRRRPDPTSDLNPNL